MGSNGRLGVGEHVGMVGLLPLLSLPEEQGFF